MLLVPGRGSGDAEPTWRGRVRALLRPRPSRGGTWAGPNGGEGGVHLTPRSASVHRRARSMSPLRSVSPRLKLINTAEEALGLGLMVGKNVISPLFSPEPAATGPRCPVA